MGFVYDPNRLNRLIASFVGNENVDMLNNALKQTGSIIVGSVVLQSMLPDNETLYTWDDADLDICTHSNSLHAMDSIITLMGLEPHNMVMSDAYRQGGCKLNTYKQGYESVSYYNKGKKVQLINVGDDIDIWKSLERVDFSILANYYDGDMVRSLYPLHVVSRSAVVLDMSLIQPQRVFKYHKRGFEIRFHQPDKLLNIRNSVFYNVYPQNT